MMFYHLFTIFHHCLLLCVSDIPSETASRTLKLVAKSLQKLANLVEFGAKESFMTVVNPFIVQNKQRMLMFLDELSVSRPLKYSLLWIVIIHCTK